MACMFSLATSPFTEICLDELWTLSSLKLMSLRSIPLTRRSSPSMGRLLRSALEPLDLRYSNGQHPRFHRLAPTKTLAKVAVRIAKKNAFSGVYTIDRPTLCKSALSNCAVEDLWWGIGHRSALKLKSFGISTALQLTQAHHGWVRRNLSVTGERLQKELLGTVCSPVNEDVPRKQNIRTARSFGQEVETYEALKEAVGTFAVNCATKLRKEEVVAPRLPLSCH